MARSERKILNYLVNVQVTFDIGLYVTATEKGRDHDLRVALEDLRAQVGRAVDKHVDGMAGDVEVPDLRSLGDVEVEYEDEDACPTCGNRPGDGVGCDDPDGCGFGLEDKTEPEPFCPACRQHRPCACENR